MLAVALLLLPSLAFADDFVYVVKPGKTPLKSAPNLDAPAKGPVGYGQKLLLKEKGDGWFRVSVPGDPLEGWISAKAVLDKRPGLDTVAVAGAASKVAASESTSTAGAIRGLDGRTAGYATAKQIPPEALSQLGRLEASAERIFRDPHSVDAKGVWHYRDVTVPGRYEEAVVFAKDEGLRAPRGPAAPPAPAAPGAPKPPAPAATASPQPTGTPAP